MYGSLAEADTYFSTNDIDSTWSDFTNAQKTAALNKATKQIDRLHFWGEKYELDQENAFPRVYDNGFKTVFFDIEYSSGSIVVPENIIEATYLQAKFLLDNLNNERLEAQKQGVTSISIGSTSESYDINRIAANQKTGLSQEAELLVSDFLIRGY